MEGNKLKNSSDIKDETAEETNDEDLEVINDSIIEARCRERLIMIGYDFDEQSKKYQSRILEIEKMAQNILAERKKLLKMAKEKDLNKTQIAKALNITRQALYKDELTGLFINAIISELSADDPDTASKRSLLKRIKELEELIDKIETKEIEAMDKKLRDKKIIDLYGKIT